MSNKRYIHKDLQRVIDQSGMANADVAISVLGFSDGNAFSHRMAGHKPFKANEIYLLCKAFKIPKSEISRFFIEPYREMHKDELEMEEINFNPSVFSARIGH